MDFLEFRCISILPMKRLKDSTFIYRLTVTKSDRLCFYGQLLEQLNVASLFYPTVFLQCYSLLLLYLGQINDDDDDMCVLRQDVILYLRG